MSRVLNYQAGAICICLTAIGLAGCKAAEWFKSPTGPRAAAAAGDHVAPPNSGYLSAGPTFAEVQAAYQPQESAVERAIRLEDENKQLRRALVHRDREIGDLRQSLESKEKLLNRVENEIQESIEEVTLASQQLGTWSDEVSKLREQTRGETESNARTLETLSDRVEALVRQQQVATPSAASIREESEMPVAPSTEIIHELPDPLPDLRSSEREERQ